MAERMCSPGSPAPGGAGRYLERLSTAAERTELGAAVALQRHWRGR
eukprot:SAG11_NODE_6763_length_1252_cov_1.277537_2_plen_45_part_01